MKLKRILVTIHIWLGITFGALWALQGLTGAMLAFNRDIQPLLLADAPSGDQLLPLDEIFVRATRAAGAKVEMLETFTPKRHLLLAYYKDPADQTKQLVVDARSGEVLDRRNPEAMAPAGGSTWSWLLHLHESLLAGENGVLFVGTSGLLLLTSVIIGLWIGWPRRGQWRHAYQTARWRTTTQKFFGWHRMVALTVGAVLVLSTTCGAYLAFSDSFRPPLASAGIYMMPYKPAASDELPQPAITAQQALDIAKTEFPGAVLMRSTLPTKKSPVYGFRLLQDGEWRRWAGATIVFVDPISGNVAGAYNPLKAPLFNRFDTHIYPTHTGEAGGLPLRILVFVGGLSLPVLYVLGLWAWLRKRRMRIPLATGPALARVN